MSRPIFGLPVATGLLLSVASGFIGQALAQGTPSAMTLEQLSADERLQLRSQLKDRQFSVGSTVADANGTAAAGSGLTARERQALRNLLRELDAGQIRPSGLSGGQINLEAMNDSDRLADPLAVNEPLVERLSSDWPVVDSPDTRRQDSAR